MTFDAFESSTELGQPIEIYQIVLGPTTYRWTSAEDSVVVMSVNYDPLACSRGRIGQSREERQATLEVTVPASFAFVRQYIGSVPGSQAVLTISRLQRPDFPGPEVVQLFEGNVQSVAFVKDGQEAKIAATPTVSAISRQVPRFTYQGLCNNVLYDDGCKVDPTNAAFRLTANVSAVSGATVTVPGAGAYGADWFVGGYVNLVVGSDFRMVLAQSGDVLTLLFPFPSGVVGQQVIVQAGCDHTIDGDCDTKFFTTEDATSNVINYGGFAFVPLSNPFQSGLDAGTNPCP